MTPSSTILLTRKQVAELLTLDDCITAVEAAFHLYGSGKAAPPGVLGAHTDGGGFHIKTSLLDLNRRYFALKVNANFFHNSARFGLPNIQGLIVLCDGVNGYPLAVMDSIEITIQRTGAATAVAAKYLARPESSTVTICGCGNQGRVQLMAITRVLPVKKAFAFDVDAEQAQQFASQMSATLGIDIVAVSAPSAGLQHCDVCITCTPSQHWIVDYKDVRPGTFVAGVGADNEHKQELHPKLMAGNKVVVDVLEQCATIGDLHHAIAANIATRADVHAELGEVVAGRKLGRTSPEEITVFDSTGTALQDVAAAAIVYERALASRVCNKLNFFA
ncbi:MAG: ornithine cyclodeaminase family protein [Acidobacteriales bacterium]|nr:ornithine cyclodeaminase family protein [Terriglobales bacterium]